jgi:MFS family permease
MLPATERESARISRAVRLARWRLAALGCSQSAHFLATYCLRVYVVLLVAAEGATQRDTAWHLATTLFMLPAIVLAPCYGALGNSLPKRAALVGSAGYCLVVMALFSWWGQAWLACVAAIALGSSLYTPVRHALLPAAASDTHLPLPRIVSAIETAAVLSIVAGIVLGGLLMPVTWDQVSSASALQKAWATVFDARGPAVVVAIILSLKVLCLLTAFAAHFASDVYRPSSAQAALAGFLRDTRRLLTTGHSPSMLLAICFLRGLVTISAGALIADSLARGQNPTTQYQLLILIAVLTMLGTAVGSFLAGLIGDRTRNLGLVPVGATGLMLALGWIALFPTAPSWLCVLVGVCVGLVNVPLISSYQASVPSDALGNGMAILNTAGFASMTAMSLLMVGVAATGILSTGGQLWVVTILSALGAAMAWRGMGHLTCGAAQIKFASRSPE